MKLLICTDIHRSMKALKSIRKKIQKHNPDLICCAGDVSIADRSTKEILKTLSRIARNRKVLMLHGNHEDESTFQNLCKEFNNIIFLHKKHIIIGNVIFFGYGGDGFSMIDNEFKRIGKKFLEFAKKNRTLKTVLLTHGPPYKTRLDRIFDGYCGNKSYREFIVKCKPVLAVSGHIHENFGKEDFIGITRIINPGPFGKIVLI